MHSAPTKKKAICDALGSISVTVDEDEMVQICPGGLAQKYGPIQTTICTREKSSLSFFDLQMMLLVEENHTGVSTSMHANIKMLYTDANRPHSRGGRGGSTRNGGDRYEQNHRHRGGADNSGPSTSRGSQGGVGSQQKQSHRLLVLWSKGPQGERMLEETS